MSTAIKSVRPVTPPDIGKVERDLKALQRAGVTLGTESRPASEGSTGSPKTVASHSANQVKFEVCRQ